MIKRVLIILMISVLSLMTPSLIGNGYQVVSAASKVQLNKTSISIYVGNTYSLKFSNTKDVIKWSTSNKAIATVNASGKVKGIKQGTATITAKIGKSTYKCKVNVNNCTISKTSITVVAGDMKEVSIKGSSGKITWKSLNKKVATINSKGIITGVKEGTADITGTYKAVKYTCTVIVEKRKLDVKEANINTYYNTKILIKVMDKEVDEKLSFKVDDAKVISCELGEWVGEEQFLNINVKKKGIATITITSNHSSQKLIITVNTNNSISYENDKSYIATQIYNLSSPSTVQINTDSAIGSGFYIDNGIIVTNYHVIKGASKIAILNHAGKTINVDKVLGFNETLDIALLSVNTKNEYLSLNKHGVTVGEEVYSIGSSLGLTDTFTNGIVTNNYRYIEGGVFIQMNASISQGNSGGPLLNKYGEVMGINTSSYVSGQNLNLALEINQIYQVSTNNPLTIEEFSKINSSNDMVLVEENEEFTADYTIGQKISVGDFIEGKMKAGGEYDYYKINITESGYYIALVVDELRYEYETDLLLTLYNDKTESMEPDTLGYVDNAFYQITYLTPGIYYVEISPRDEYYNYTYTDIYYRFSITQSD